MAKGLRDLVNAQKAREMLVIPKPTLEQAVKHLQAAVAEADRRGIKSPTMEAIRALVWFPETPVPVRPAAEESIGIPK